MKVTVVEYDDYGSHDVEGVITDPEIIKRLKKSSGVTLTEHELNDVSNITNGYGCKNDGCEVIFAGDIKYIKEHEEVCEYGN